MVWFTILQVMFARSAQIGSINTLDLIIFKDTFECITLIKTKTILS